MVLPNNQYQNYDLPLSVNRKRIQDSIKTSSLPFNTEGYSYRFYKNLNQDVHLKSDEMGRWDVDFDYANEDWVMVDGFESVVNACVIMIMTRFNELGFMDLYENFGCRIHELIKANKSKNVMYHIEIFITEVLKSMRRVKKVNWVVVTDNPNSQLYQYQVNFSVSCTVDEEYEDMDMEEIVEGEFAV